MVSKIFEILAGIKKTSRITKAAQLESVEKIVNEVETGLVNPVEAYVMLDYLKKVTEEAMKEIKASTLTYIQTEGENEAFNVQLGLVSKKDYNYGEDKDWVEVNKKKSMYDDAQKVREKYLKDLVVKSLEAGRETPITFTSSISIVPKPISNT